MVHLQAMETMEDTRGSTRNSEVDSKGRCGNVERECYEIISDDFISKLLKELNVESFDSLSGVSRLMDAYEERSRCRVAIRRSGAGKFRVYHCVEHKDCVFKVHVGRRRKDGKFVIKDKLSFFGHKKYADVDYYEAHHSRNIEEGHQWRRARVHRVQEYVLEAVQTAQAANPKVSDVLESGLVTARHVMEVGAMKGDPISYIAAKRTCLKQRKEKCCETIVEHNY